MTKILADNPDPEGVKQTLAGWMQEMRDENDKLRQQVSDLEAWKADAIRLLMRYDDLAEPFASLGESKVDALIGGVAKLRENVADLCEAIDPDTLRSIANEIECHKHSARAHSLRVIAKRQQDAAEKALAALPSERPRS